MRAVLVLAFLVACGGEHPATVDAAGVSCVTATACTTDNDCKVAPGTRCNTALPAPHCEPLTCGNDGLACASPEFCAAGLVCFDKDHFGETTTIYQAGVCAVPTATVDACNARCMQAWVFSQGMVLDECTQPQATALCQDVCSRYPKWDTCENYFGVYDANDWHFAYMNCPSGNLCPSIGLHCGTMDTSLAHSSNGCL